MRTLVHGLSLQFTIVVIMWILLLFGFRVEAQDRKGLEAVVSVPIVIRVENRLPVTIRLQIADVDVKLKTHSMKEIAIPYQMGHENTFRYRVTAHGITVTGVYILDCFWYKWVFGHEKLPFSVGPPADELASTAKNGRGIEDHLWALATHPILLSNARVRDIGSGFRYTDAAMPAVHDRENADIDTEIDKIAKSGRFSPLPPATLVPTEGGVWQGVEVKNQTPYMLKLLYSGPVRTTRTVSSGHSISLDIPPGNYRIAVRALGGNVRSLYGRVSFSADIHPIHVFYIR